MMGETASSTFGDYLQSRWIGSNRDEMVTPRPQLRASLYPVGYTLAYHDGCGVGVDADDVGHD